jgi:hypothetical protein
MTYQLDTYKTVQALAAGSTEGYWDTADEYGEPGYGSTWPNETDLVVLGSYWCRCDRNSDLRDLHSIEDHYPRIWAQLTARGVEFEWHDEWVVDHETGKAYRTQPDSYSWTPSILITEHGDLMTPDDDIEVLVEHCDETGVPLSRNFATADDLTAAGFTPYSTDNETGWHPGQTGDPVKVAQTARRLFPDCQVIHYVTDQGQFDTRWTTYIRTEPVDPQYLGDLMEFNTVIEVDDSGRVKFRPDLYAPDVYETDDGTAVDGTGWDLLDGYSGQYLYSGPVMHPSEYIGGLLARDILDSPGIYAAVVVDDYTEATLDDPDSDNVAGWAIAQREDVAQ